MLQGAAEISHDIGLIDSGMPEGLTDEEADILGENA
jgi:hypothetical protein